MEDSLLKRPEPLKISQLLGTIRDLCQPRAEEPEALVEMLEKVPGYDPAVRALANFMVNPQEDSERAASHEADRHARNGGPGTARETWRSPFSPSITNSRNRRTSTGRRSGGTSSPPAS